MANKKNAEDKSFEEIRQEIEEQFKKCVIDDPKEEDLELLRKYFIQNPHLYSFVYEVAKFVEKSIIDEVTSHPAYKIYIETSIWQMREEMGYESAPTIERILIDNIVNCWLRLISIEMSPPNPRTYRHDVREDRLKTTQNRFRQACLTYIRIKKLISKTPALQINFTTDTAQQVNVTGGATKSAENEEN